MAQSASHRSAPLPDYASVKRYLYGLKYHGAKYGLDRMEALCEQLGHPERLFPCIHIAGTNGKGSTAAMLESIYRHAGYKTGLFTSPHLVHQGERIQVNRKILSHDEIVTLTNRLRIEATAIEARSPDLVPSFFEFMTAMAFLRFAREKVDIAIIETGLGGRLDATNVVDPELSVITSVGLDHMNILGDTLHKIAFEKGGIIKPGKPVVAGHLPSEAESVIRALAQLRKSPVHAIREVFDEHPAKCPATNLVGDFQRWNAASATVAVRLLRRKFPVTDEQIAMGLQNVDWAGRWDRRRLGSKRLVLDATHNEEGARMLEGNLSKLLRQNRKKLVVIAGTLGEDRAKTLFPVVAKYAREIILVRPEQPRASTFEEMEAAIPVDFSGTVKRATVKEIFPFREHCTLGGANETIVATGSLYLIGEIMEQAFHDGNVGEQSLQD